MEKKFTEKESLDLIIGMIDNAKANLQKGLGKHFLLWGYLVVFASLTNFIFWGKQWAAIGWLIMLPIGAVGAIIIGRKNSRETRYYTHVDKLIGVVWSAFTISMAAITLAAFNPFGVIPLTWSNLFLFYPTLLALAAMALFISGKAYRFKPLIYGAVVCWVCAITCYFVELQYNVLLYCIGFLLGYIVPGHLIIRKGGKTNQDV